MMLMSENFEFIYKITLKKLVTNKANYVTLYEFRSISSIHIKYILINDTILYICNILMVSQYEIRYQLTTDDLEQSLCYFKWQIIYEKKIYFRTSWRNKNHK